jgi:hypothetical protein
LDELREVYPLRASRLQRRVWTIPSFDVDFRYIDNDRDVPNAVYLTYQLAANKLDDDIGIDLLKVCRQTYLEASKVFYGSNVFSFTSDYRIPCAFAFLCDRPAESLLQIKALELALMEDCNMRGTTQAHYPIIRRSTDCLVLQYAYQYFTELCTLLSTPRIRLRELYLTIETMGRSRSTPPTTTQDFLSCENRDAAMPRPWPILWLDPLLKVKSFQSIQICWISGQPRIQRMADAVEMMRRHMLLNARRSSISGRDNESEDGSVPVRFRMMCYDDRPCWSAWTQNALINDALQDESDLEWGDYMAVESRWNRRHIRPTVEAYERAYVCCCQLKSI